MLPCGYYAEVWSLRWVFCVLCHGNAKSERRRPPPTSLYCIFPTGGNGTLWHCPRSCAPHKENGIIQDFSWVVGTLEPQQLADGWMGGGVMPRLLLEPETQFFGMLLLTSTGLLPPSVLVDDGAAFSLY